jgi:NAD(P)H dehydrogenase (quinone)
MIGVTGATGQIGGMVARQLAAAGSVQRLLVRDAARAPRLPGAEVVVAGGYGEAESARRALAGVDVLLMVSGQESADRLAQHFTFIDAAAAAGVSHIVYTSFFGAAPDATFTLARDHWATEERIRASGMRFTFLRDNLYMDVLPYFAGDGVIRGPAGDGRLSAVAREDVARVAVAALRDPGAHTGKTYDLTGPEALSLTEVAQALTAATGQPVRFEDETAAEAYPSRAKYNAPAWQVEAWVSTYLAIRNGEMARVSGDVGAVTGKPPLAFGKFLEGNRPPLR